MDAETPNSRHSAAGSTSRRRVLIFLALIIVVAAAIVRSSIATSLDSFTFDEAYHVGAGAAYVKTGDFRLNPEQPPLTKLWVGAYVTLLGYNLSPYRPFADKSDEREFVEKDAYQNNDSFLLQSRARTAMLGLNGLLLLGFAFAVWRVLGAAYAIGVALLLAIDPTVAAHLPVVMTDLPVGLAAGMSFVLAARAFLTWNWVDLLLAGVATGLTLSAKHSGVVILAAVVLIGAAMALVVSKGASTSPRLKRLGGVAVLALVSVVVLWAFYGFQNRETPGTTEETFNRPLVEKISDVKSPLYRAGLNALTTVHLFPRAFIWGLADTIRAGAEGRAIQVKAFGKRYYSKAPFYFFPGAIAAKLPLGLLGLSIVGVFLLIFGPIPWDKKAPILVVAACSAPFLLVLMTGSSYAGVRHALPLYPIVIVVGASTVYAAIRSRSRIAGAGVAVCIIAAMISAIPQMRPWEYFNELAGGAEHGHLYFSDEGVDLSQRLGEMAEYYHRELKPNGELPFIAYFSNGADRRARGMDWVGRVSDRDAAKYEQETVTGTFMIGANELGEAMWWDVGKPFRGIAPALRLGNVFIFRGTFGQPKAMAARGLFYRAIYSKVYAPEPDIAGSVPMIEKSLQLDDSNYVVSLELGNIYLKLGDREKALAAYSTSLSKAPKEDSVYGVLAEQVRRVQSEPLDSIPGLRNPGIE